MIRWTTRCVCILAVATLAVAGCGSSSKSSKDKSTTTSGQAATTTAVTNETTTTAASTTTMTVTPNTGLQDGQTVQVSATGFPPNDNLGINECADKGDQTQAGDCNLTKLVPVKSDAQGKVTGQYKVTKGPFGGNNITCTAQQACLLSVSELVAGNPKNASQGIKFAGT